MANPTVVATVKGATSNSYVTRAEAQTYFDGSFNGSATWEAAGAADRDRAIISATSRLEQVEFLGNPTDTATPQALKWPRSGTYDQDGTYLDADLMPDLIKNATYEMAIALLKGEIILADSGLEGFLNVKVGPLDVTPRHGRTAGALPRQVSRLLTSVMASAMRTVRS